MAASTAVAWVPRRFAHADAKAEVTRSGIAPLAFQTDHGGVPVPRANYTRIASASTLADALLLELCEPTRIVAFTARATQSPTHGFRYAGKAKVDRVQDLEAILSLHPDLVLVSGVGDPRPVARLRDAGLVVFDLGEMRGLATLVPNIREVAELIGYPERGERFARALMAKMAGVAVDVPAAGRKRALYLSVYGGRLFGGAAGTSYSDVLRAAGLLDGADGYRNWPEYSVEQVLRLNPEVIVTHDGMRPRICEHAGLASLRACKDPSGVVGIEDELLGDPGPAMLEAAQAIRASVYGAPGADSQTAGQGQ